MASLQASANSVRAAAGSVSTCTPTTTTVLSELLLLKSNPQISRTSTIPNKSTGTLETRGPKDAKTTRVKSRSQKVHLENTADHGEQLSPRERIILATEVVNATLKALTEAIKSPAPAHRKESSRGQMKTSSRKTLRRSNSMPLSPLQTRSLNRVSSSPNICTKSGRPSSASSPAAGCRAVAECARVAFTCLRGLQGGTSKEVNLSPLQLDNGMSVLIGKLTALGLDDLAVKELRILKRRLDPPEILHTSRGTTPGTSIPTMNNSSLEELLEFRERALTAGKLSLVVTTQQHILRLIASSQKQKSLDVALPILQPSHPSSPTRLILLASKELSPEKTARQLQSLSEILFSLTPSISPADDALSLEPSLSVAPELAIQLQALALHNRILWWRLAGHTGDTAKDILDPFLRCLSAFVRRSTSNPLDSYRIAATAFKDLTEMLEDLAKSIIPGIRKALSTIYKLLASLAQDANITDKAVTWTEKIHSLLDPLSDSDARRNSVVARLVALKLRRLPSESDEGLFLGLLESIEVPLKGELSEIEGFLLEISALRRVVISILAKSGSVLDSLTSSLREMCEILILACPRLCLRYLGSVPNDKSCTKDVLRYEQRRQFVNKLSLHAIDSTLFIIRTFMVRGSLTWELIDSNLQACLNLLERFETTPEKTVSTDGPLPPSLQSHHVKISNLYFSHYLNMRRDSDNSKDSQQFRALKRSTDCVRSRSQHERNTAQFTTKLERLAAMFGESGRFDELFETLLVLRDESIGNETLAIVAMAATTKPIRKAWAQDEKTTELARTIQSLVKTQFRCLNPASKTLLYEGPWSEEERGSLLEHHLDVLCKPSSQSSASLAFQTKVFEACLALYTRESYPIRRLRTITRIFSLDQIHQQKMSNSLSSELTITEMKALHVEGTKDEGLQKYFTHFQTFITTLLELQQEKPSIGVIKRCLAVWSSIKSRCPDMDALELEIEDVPRLLVHLQLIADYMEMRGWNLERISVLRLIAEFVQVRSDTSDPNGLVVSFIRLGTGWLQLGYSGKAGLALEKAQSSCNQSGIMPITLLYLHLSYSEYLIAIGNYDKSEDYLLRAQVALLADDGLEGRPQNTSHARSLKIRLLSKASLLYSTLDLERGALQDALAHAKQSVRLMRGAWTNTERLFNERALADSSPGIETEKLSEEVSQLNLSTVATSTASISEQPIGGSPFWALVAPLLRGLAHLSDTYAHHGMFQETMYYADQAQILAKEIGSDACMAITSVHLGSKWLMAGALDKGSDFLMRAKELCNPEEQNSAVASLTYHLGTMHGLLGDYDAELSAYEEAGKTLKGLTEPDFINRLDLLVDSPNSLEGSMAKLKVSGKKIAVQRAATARPKAAARRKAVIREKVSMEGVSSIDVECPQIKSLQAKVLRQKSRVLTSLKKYAEAQIILQQTDSCSTTQMDIVEQGLLMAKHLLLESKDQMNEDPIYSVLQESTISFPSVVGQSKVDRNTGERLSIAKLTLPNKVANNKGSLGRSKSPGPHSFIDKLRQAQEHLLEVHPIALTVAPVSILHSISALLNSIAMLLSAAGQIKGRPLAHPGFASCSIDSVRTLILRRERKAILADPRATMKQENDKYWPTCSSTNARRSSIGVPCEMARFQRDYIDIIPKNWDVISISLSNSRNELSITKLQAGQSPFVLRLPLGRNNSIDADEEVFDFEQGVSELLEILQLANESAHDARDMFGRDAKTAWWEERETLDARLRDLLENIEKVWLGGFTGIFSQHTRILDLQARFQKSFQNILDKYLPSRQKNGRRNTSSRINLDLRILELFIGLGDASAEDCDFSEPLTDLLYFVVDVLQFHGELNAYAEIDFDSIVVETHDALRSYHEAARTRQKNEGRHTILILDKTLHAFPWESLPCMDGLAVSRLPSLGCLRDRILEQQTNIPEDRPAGQYVRRDNGSYILNPGGDLKSTQATFQKPLQSLENWNGITKREPTEEEVRSDLEARDILLYFGHGSGAQYIRAREIRRLKKCAVTFLMGCSSGSLVETGEFEPYGPPINYMHAGCPALVATLWDVTDKDIDRFAKTTLEHWGLFKCQPEAAAKGKSRRIIETVPEGTQLSLVEAVAKGRQACNLRYLTAAAVCIYGVPVYIK